MGIFSTGLSGLNAAQNALATTSNNISNVYTPGFNREVTVLGEQSAGTGGVQVNDIERQFDRYVADQLNNARTQSSALETYTQQIDQIDNLLADQDAGLAPLMQEFFSSVEDLAAAPSDPAARQGLIGTAQTLSAQFRAFDGYLQDMQHGINDGIKDEITQINNTTRQIAGLNRTIALARARNGEAPNGLLNQRDHLVSTLSERLDSRLSIQDGKTYNITLPNGQPLVAGTEASRLSPVQAETDPQRTIVGYRDGAGNLVALDEGTITGGRLGGLLRFRQESLDRTQDQIGQLAVSLTTAFNERHKQGLDLNGDQGADFFTIRGPQGYGAPANSATIDTIAFEPAHVDEIRATDYQVRYESGAFKVIRQDSGQEIETQWDGSRLAFGGVSMTFAKALADGDTFEVQPVRRAAAGMDVQVHDTDRIAAALGPVRPMPYSKIDFQVQSPARLGETESLATRLPVQGQSSMETSGIKPFGFIPAGTKNITIETNHSYADDDIQLFTRDGQHLVGTPVTGSNPDVTWSEGTNGINSAADLESRVFTLKNGFAEGTRYSADNLLDGTQHYSVTPADVATSTYNDMAITYTGDGDWFDGSKNDGMSVKNIERVHIDQVNEPLFVVISGSGIFEIKATWDSMPGEATAPGSGGVTADTAPASPLQSQLAVSHVTTGSGFDALDAAYRPPGFAVQAADDGSLRLGFYGADNGNNLFVSPDAGSVPSSPPPDGLFSVYKQDGTKINDVLSVNDGSGNTLAVGDRLTIRDDATGKTVVSFTIDELPDKGTSGVTFTGITETGPGDNRNALALQALQNEHTVGPDATFSGAYGVMVSDVGNRAHVAQANLDAQQGIEDQLRAVQQSESGVNLDEEAANLIRYQQYYQANARVIDAATKVIDTLLGLHG
ncbi:flagellar hook-associated protein FlgK [Modicisalibacter sp. 'Wilcox']|uniref:flagellar hook-associated protein FlgK n=1 Tax=Modicisalibacter sp. 'Wilcox' TaxID=2679914 RepID=UPI001F096BE5|nr:flagellar hook-associated protein FlgK [Modicisalibacter sp. 'Wilcox']